MAINSQTERKGIAFQEYVRQPAKVGAALMKLGEYNDLQGWEMPSDEDPDTDGYIIERQGSGHNLYTWMSKEEFEGSHTNEGIGAVSDGYHTYDELYKNRHILFINVMRAHQQNAFITRRNKEGEEWEGWFIAGINTSRGQISYHLPEEYWDICSSIAKVIDCNADYDGHDNEDVLGILLRMHVNKDLFSYRSEVKEFFLACKEIFLNKDEEYELRREAAQCMMNILSSMDYIFDED